MAMEQLLSFAPDLNVRQCACVQIVNDATNELREVFTARLRSTSAEHFEGSTTATVTILDDDSGMHFMLC